ncbi:MAG: transcriptional repressor [Clostridia bacterium]|nr:transcriptional repressor [Clostridia bacterium]
MTKQRKLILEVLRSTSCHPTADWVYQRARQVMPGISLGTVYRNLRVLEETGEILELSYGSGLSRFDGNPKNHYHFVCLRCGRVLDVCLEVKEELEKVVANELSCEVFYHRTEFYGVCNECRDKNQAEPKNNILS